MKLIPCHAAQDICSCTALEATSPFINWKNCDDNNSFKTCSRHDLNQIKKHFICFDSNHWHCAI